MYWPFNCLVWQIRDLCENNKCKVGRYLEFSTSLRVFVVIKISMHCRDYSTCQAYVWPIRVARKARREIGSPGQPLN